MKFKYIKIYSIIQLNKTNFVIIGSLNCPYKETLKILSGRVLRVINKFDSIFPPLKKGGFPFNTFGHMKLHKATKHSSHSIFLNYECRISAKLVRQKLAPLLGA